jgi:hypothetical protein
MSFAWFSWTAFLEVRPEAEGDSVIYINRRLDYLDQSNFSRYVKIGLESVMVRYSDDSAVNDDLMLRKVP